MQRLRRDKQEIAQMLIKAKAGVNAADGTLKTRLHIAGRYRYNEMIDLLIREGANVNSSDKYATVPLHFAAHGLQGRSLKDLSRLGRTLTLSPRLRDTALLGHASHVVLQLSEDRR